MTLPHVYDPRDKTWKYSNNPALILLDILCKRGYPVDEESFKAWATFCEESMQVVS